MPNKAFLEITNVCNLACSFCHGTRRPARYMTAEEFTCAAEKLRAFADYLYFHVMGEPLLHPLIGDFLAVAEKLGFRVILTTNGTLLRQKREILLSAGALHKVSISLHSYEVNAVRTSLEDYLDDCFSFASAAADAGIISVMRLWNLGGEDKLNADILGRMHTFFDGENGADWKKIYSGYKISEKVFLEWGDRFDWPDEAAAYVGDSHSCYGLRDQIGVLSDGTVVPCCLDADGAIALGNIFTDPLEKILSSPRAVSLRNSFEIKRITEPLCQRCGYAHGKQYK
ncbi:MAG: radical SAM protein [Clostridia bacterium]|nr:radical SAM protein [Clostridia bacterium]